MDTTARKKEILDALQADILRLERFSSKKVGQLDVGLGPVHDAFPNAAFPLGAVHEFLCGSVEQAAAGGAFISALLGTIMGKSGTAMWIGSSRQVFPPGLQYFGIHPERIIFVDLQKEKHVLWAMEEALRCSSLTAVVAELDRLSFIASRRLQLAVEQSRVTGFVLRRNCRNIDTTACVSRWKVTPLPAEPIDDLPGIGYPRWKVELIRIRNGRPGTWEITWKNKRFSVVVDQPDVSEWQKKKAG